MGDKLIKAWKVTKLKEGKMPPSPEFFYVDCEWEAFKHQMMVSWIDGTFLFPPAYKVEEVEISEQEYTLHGINSEEA